MTKFSLGLIKSRYQESGIALEEISQVWGVKDKWTYWEHENEQNKFKTDTVPLLYKIFQCRTQKFFSP